MNYYVFRYGNNFLIVNAATKEIAQAIASDTWTFVRELSGFEQSFIETWK